MCAGYSVSTGLSISAIAVTITDPVRPEIQGAIRTTNASITIGGRGFDATTRTPRNWPSTPLEGTFAIPRQGTKPGPLGVIIIEGILRSGVACIMVECIPRSLNRRSLSKRYLITFVSRTSA